ncbi:cytochrome c oxidase accessory protein CcoG [Aurantimonas sp. VKM B-3413]|uniref:cytochrome c oxidase accessory protein CcoG n=1 Tax=Aurantimonas sp. VKM B-3413 TaxID=2779401 RepID=UPI001E5ED72F|nr:cytochrome c oxidase accessory protein CcoG [Aurantimonas sp. VKM B-3413]MCB8838587.1 cytochrome c oxidase accessory protein CcoG [Aurantimonas sp. VKM B-3413]
MLQRSDIHRFDVEPVNAPERQSQPLYEARKKIHPKRAEGRFRRLKWIIMLVTLGIYYVTPWLRWDRGPFAPDQAVLIDLANRRFYFFFIEIWPQEFIFVAGLLVMAGIGLFLVTSVVGRAWCGYACPQTVWTDLFLVVERFFEGDRNARIRLDKAPWSFDKVRKRVLKHSTWLLIAVATGGAWIFYFADAPTLLWNFLRGDAPFVAYATVGILTATTYVLGGLMREQVCIYMCPWPRIQAAMLDEDSLVVTYNDWRGEPKSHGAKKAAAAGLSVGDCVDCNACVAVCPTGIDIRDGQQLACITCALCIDACDGVMDKLGRERGLISYATLKDYNSNMAIATDPATGAIDPARVRDETGRFRDRLKHFDWHVFLRPRTLIYAGLWAAIGVGLLVALMARERLELNVQRDRNPVYVRLSDGSIRNGYTVKLLNMIPEPREFRLSLEGLPGATMYSDDLSQPEGRSFAVKVDPDRLRTLKFFVVEPASAVKPGTTDFRFVLNDMNSSESAVYDAAFEAPENGK